MDKKKPIDALPAEFASVDEAITFWDAHDTTDYLDVSTPIKVKSKFRARHFGIEVDLKYPNSDTIEAIAELENGSGQRFETTAKLFADWKKLTE